MHWIPQAFVAQRDFVSSFSNCLQTKETEAIDPSALEQKYYAIGVGNVLVVDLVTGERLELIHYHADRPHSALGYLRPNEYRGRLAA